MFSIKCDIDKNTIKKRKRQALAAGMAIVQTKLGEYVPADSGELLRSLMEPPVYLNDNEAEISTNVPYAPYIEYGTGIYNSQGLGRTTPWRYQDSKGEWHTTSGYDPDKDRPRGGHYMERAFLDSTDEVLKAMGEVLFNDKL